MTFLNQALLYGSAALLIPLIIHILNRSRFKTVEWGAMHLLDSVIKVNHKRFRIDQLILLLLRCALPVLLALCLARPVLTGSRMLEGGAPVSLVILLDTSYSMETLETVGLRFENAVASACELVGGTSRGSDIAVILTGGLPTPLFDQPVFDSAAVIRRLKQQQAGYGSSDMQGALNTALVTLAGMSQPRRELIVISDFQPADWGLPTGDAAELIRQQIESMEFSPNLTLLKVGSSAKSNLSIDSLEYPQRTLGVGQRLDLRANLRNHGEEEMRNARVVLRIDGTEEAVSQVSLSGKSTSQVYFPTTMKTPGSHVVEVEILVDDPILIDNRLSAAVTIWESLQVLLVDGDPSSQPLQGEVDFLSIALTPYTFGRVRLSDLIETHTVRTQDLSLERIGAARVVVLANVPRLSDEQLSTLVNYVQNGGAVLVCPGNKIDLNWYREKLFGQGTGLLPRAYGNLLGNNEQSGKDELGEKQSESTRLVTQHYETPALEFFNDPANGDLSKAEIKRWYQLVGVAEATDPAQNSVVPLTEGSETPAPEQGLNGAVLARLETGDPFLVERRFGSGVVVQMATTCDADWTDFPLRPVYVPMMQQLITNIAARLSPPQNIATGEPIVALLRATESNPNSPTSSALSVLTPDGLRRSIETTVEGNLHLARYTGTQRPGLYTLTLPSNETQHFVASTNRNESELQLLNESQMSSLAESLGGSNIASSSEFLKQDRLRRHGREIWKLLLIGLLLGMFLELVLQQRFARVRV